MDENRNRARQGTGTTHSEPSDAGSPEGVVSREFELESCRHEVAAYIRRMEDTVREQTSGESTADHPSQTEVSQGVQTVDAEELQDCAEALIDDFKSLNEVTTEQITAVREAANNVTEFRKIIEDFDSTVQEITEQSRETLSQTRNANETADEAIMLINRAESAVDDTATQLEDLQGSVERIDEKTDLINDVAKQTNLLALNASIEAARAGNDGTGFEVVADEIKTLAGDAQSHSDTIERVVDNISGESEQAVSEMEDVVVVTRDIAESLMTITEELESIAENAEETPEQMERLADLTESHAEKVDEIGQSLLEVLDRRDRVHDAKEDLADTIGTVQDMADDGSRS